MSHTIFVPSSETTTEGKAQAILAKLPGIQFDVPPSAWPIGQECLMWREGSARGVSMVLQPDGIMIRYFTCASRVDVDLALDAVIALATAAAGTSGFFKRLVAKKVLAANECDEEFTSIAAIEKRYNNTYRTEYVTWGPQQLASMVMEQDDANATVAVNGPWCHVRLNQELLSQLRTSAASDEAFSQAVLSYIIAQQSSGRQLRTALRQGNAAQLATVALPIANDVVAPWLQEDVARCGADLMWQTIAQLPSPVLLANLHDILNLVTDETRWQSPVGRTIYALALEHANSDAAFATTLANNALAAAQAGNIAQALAAFDVVVDMAPQNVGNVQVAPLIDGKPTGQQLEVNAQSSWACNATWAVQADNNKLPVDPKRARHYLTKCLPYAPSNPAIYLNATCIAVELGDLTQALAHTANAKRCGFSNMQEFQREPLLAPLRNHPGFAQAFAGG